MQPIHNFSSQAKGTLAELLAKARAMASLQAQLCQLLPESTAKQMTGVSVDGTRLLVQASSATWAFRLRLEQTRLLQAAQALYPNLCEIHIHVLPEQTQTQPTPAAPTPCLPDAQTLTAMEALATKLGSDELAQSWQKLTQGLRQQTQQQKC